MLLAGQQEDGPDFFSVPNGDWRQCITPRSFWSVKNLVESAWLEHAPFAFWLTEAVQPRQFVELGTHNGFSYFAFCQAIQYLGIQASCHAVDTWQGDEHAGFYGEDVYARVTELNQRNYAGFSSLIRSRFDEALSHFADGSIDLLHIDGRHRYEDVRNDFKSWLPKLSNRGVVLFHDTNVRERDFGVWRIWSEITKHYPSFEFMHGHGLGVLAVGSDVPSGLQPLLTSNVEQVAAIRAAYAHLGQVVGRQWLFELQATQLGANQQRLQAYEAELAQLRGEKAEQATAYEAELAQLRGEKAEQAAAYEAELAQLRGEKAEQATAYEAELAQLRGEKAEQTTAYEAELAQLRGEKAEQATAYEAELAQLRGEKAELRTQAREAAARLSEVQGRLSEIQLSESWRITAPLRAAGTRMPAASRFARRAAKLIWWTVTLQLPKRIPERWRRRTPNQTAAKAIKERDKALSLHDAVTKSATWRLTRPFRLAMTRIPDALRRKARRTASSLYWSTKAYLLRGRQLLMVRRSSYFDRSWYLSRYPDVGASALDPAIHYVFFGASEGREPGPNFSGERYLDANPDVRNSGINPLVHYVLYGEREGRQVKLALKGSAGAPIREHTQINIPGSATQFAYQPLVSIIMPVFNIEAEWLRRAISSVQAQTYPNWELCICDDGSTAPDTISALVDLESQETRLRVKRLPKNCGISKASNEALAFAAGEFVAFLDNDDELEPDALESYVAALNDDVGIDVIYSDEDKLSERGIREEPFLKPDWSPGMFREVMYVGHLLLVRRNRVEQIGGFDSTYDGVQDYELMLRLSENTPAIHHVHKVLYHWRRIPGSIADRPDSKPNIGHKQVAAVNAHLVRMGINATAQIHPTLPHRAVLVPNARDRFPRVSIIIPTKDAPEFISRCLTSIFEKSTYPNFEVVVVDNGTTDDEALAVLDRFPIIRVPYSEPFNFSRANNLAVAASTGDALVFLNNDTEVVEGDWLEQMLFFLDDPNVGAVGPLLLYPDRSVQHAGVALGIRGTADHVLRGLPEDSDGYFGSLSCTREVSCVTFACVMLRKEDFDAVGGLSVFYQTHYQDVDFCMRLTAIGRRILYTPRTRLIHYESATRGSAYDNMDRALLLDCWGAEIGAGDPYSRWESESNAAARCR